MATANGPLALQTRDQYAYQQAGSLSGRGFAAFDASGTFYVPSGVHRLFLELQGGNGLCSYTVTAGCPPSGGTANAACPGSICRAVLDVTPGQKFTISLGGGSVTVTSPGQTTLQATVGASGSVSITSSTGSGSGSTTAGTAATGGNLLNTSSATGFLGACLLWW